MAGVTSTGFVTKTFAEIRDEIYADAISDEYFGADFPLTPDSPFGNYTNIIAAAIKESSWDLAQMVYDQLDLAKAEGINLDKLGAYIGLGRLSASGSQGLLEFRGSVGEVIPSGTVVKSSTNPDVVVVTRSSVTYDNTACYKAFITVASIIKGETYTVSVNGNLYSVVSALNATEETILQSLKAVMLENNVFESEVVKGELVITSISRSNSLSIVVSSLLTLPSTALVTTGENTVKEEVIILAGTLTAFESTPIGTISVNNPLDFTTGRLGETDEEYRIRLGERKANTGVATYDAIVSSIGNLNGVTSVSLINNDTVEYLPTGQLPKSIQCFVIGGDEGEIAQTIWDTKSSTTRTYGNLVRVVTDVQGLSQSVYFSRPTQMFAYVNVNYTIYSEEAFPSNGESLIVQAVLDYGDTLEVGEDIIPKRIASTIYQKVNGLDDVEVEVGLTPTSNTPPTEYSSSRIAVDETESILFSKDTTSVTV